jgi:hypothetical protein
LNDNVVSVSLEVMHDLYSSVPIDDATQFWMAHRQGSSYSTTDASLLVESKYKLSKVDLMGRAKDKEQMYLILLFQKKITLPEFRYAFDQALAFHSYSF